MGVFFPSSCYLRMVVVCKRLKEPYGRSSAAMSIYTPPQPPHRGPTSGKKLVYGKEESRAQYHPFMALFVIQHSIAIVIMNGCCLLAFFLSQQ